MKQKITLEIENDTGVEFEEKAEFRTPKTGEYFFDYDEKPKKASADFTQSFFVLTPKVDHELEEAKRKFEGKWFKLNSMDMVQKARDVVRSGKGDILILCTNGQTEHVNTCTPFPIPVWRCCESDKPKQDGNYVTREKETKRWKTLRDFSVVKGWQGNPYNTDEWLDEGGE